MVAEALLLRVARTVVAEIVEAGLADRNHFRMLRDRDQFGGVNVEFLVRIMRMGPDRTEDIRELFRDGQYLPVSLHPS